MKPLIKDPKRSYWLLAILILLILTAAALAMWLVKINKAFDFNPYGNLTRDTFTTSPSTTTDASPSLATANESSPTPTPVAANGDRITDEGVTWNSKPQPLAQDPGFYVNLDKYLQSTYDTSLKIAYYTVGQDHGKPIILAVIPPEGPGNASLTYFVKESDNSARYLTKLGTFTGPEYYGPELSSKVTRDTKTIYKAIDIPQVLKDGDAILTLGYAYERFFSDLAAAKDTQIKPIHETRYGQLYSVTTKQDNYSIQRFAIKLADSTVAIYQSYPNFQKDDQVPQVTWSDGSVNKDTYRVDGQTSCGSVSGVAIMNQKDLNGLTQIGKTNQNEPVYGFTSADSATVTYFYKLYARDWASQDENAISKDAISKTDYLKKHAVFVYKDTYGRLILLTSTTYGIQAECGKPVIYLYPTHSTEVSVKVGAKVTKSEPAYGNGWTVTAQPSGKLTTRNGQTFDSLFWEGTGNGSYPTINQGFVVPQSQVEKTLREQLVRLGLNTKESADFLEFWLPKMPHTPYVRLTWLDTRAMDQLAPLTVNPKPDTNIRIFLDFAGLEKPVQLQPQRLSAPARNGFTLVEWGGLLRTNQ